MNGRVLSYAVLGVWVLLADAWFQGPLFGPGPRPRMAALLALALSALVLYGLVRERGRWCDGRFVRLASAVLALATLVRLPALLAPSSVISGDSAVNGLIAHELRIGNIPPPVYPPGYPYEGTLKVNATALLGRLVGGVSTPPLYIGLGHAFYLIWIVAVMALARGAGGEIAALGAGLFMAVSPRFLTAFSVNNVGQYQELNALGTLGLALLAGGHGLLLAAFVVGLAVWQQLVAFYFVLTLAIGALATPALRTPRSLLDGALGFAAGTYPIWIWNVANEWGTFDFFRRGAKGGPLDRLLEVPTQLARTMSISFPKMFGLNDVGLAGTIATGLALLLPALVLAMAWAHRADLRARRAGSAAFLAMLLFAITLSVFTVSKFSRRGIQRPRYLLPLYTPVAIAVGWGLARLAVRSRVSAAGAAAVILAWNTAGTLPWLTGRGPAGQRDDAFLRQLETLQIRRGHAGFTLATRYTFLSGGRSVIAGDLGPEVSWVYLPHTQRVAEDGADAYFADRPDLAAHLDRRFASLGISYERTDGLPAVFHGFSRRVELSELDGYDSGSDAAPEEAEGE